MIIYVTMNIEFYKPYKKYKKEAKNMKRRKISLLLTAAIVLTSYGGMFAKEARRSVVGKLFGQ